MFYTLYACSHYTLIDNNNDDLGNTEHVSRGCSQISTMDLTSGCSNDGKSKIWEAESPPSELIKLSISVLIKVNNFPYL